MYARPRAFFSLHFRASPEYSDISWYDLCMILVPLCSDISTRGSFYLGAQEVRVTMRARARALFFFFILGPHQNIVISYGMTYA